LKIPPFQVEAFVSDAANPDVFTALPKMSCSPLSAVPLASTTWCEPRDASRLPVPFELDHVCTAFGVAA
jgi:hypothetical protein